MQDAKRTGGQEETSGASKSVNCQLVRAELPNAPSYSRIVGGKRSENNIEQTESIEIDTRRGFSVRLPSHSPPPSTETTWMHETQSDIDPQHQSWPNRSFDTNGSAKNNSDGSSRR